MDLTLPFKPKIQGYGRPPRIPVGWEWFWRRPIGLYPMLDSVGAISARPRTIFDHSGNGLDLTMTAGFDADIWYPGPFGATIEFANTEDLSAGAPSQIKSLLESNANGGASFVMLLKRDTATPSLDSETYITGLWGNGASDTHYPYSDGTFYCSILKQSRVSITPSALVNRAEWHVVTVSHCPAFYRVYQNNVLVYDGAGESSISMNSNLDVIGYFTNNFAGKVGACYVLGTAVTGEQVNQIVLDPWGAFRSPKRKALKAPTGGGAAAGTGTPSTSVATAAGTGIASHKGTGAASTSVATAAGSGKDSPRGTGAPSTSIAAAAGTGIASRRGTGAPSTSVATAAGTGSNGKAGTGAPSTSVAQAAGTGVASHFGSGAPSTSIPTAAGSGKDAPRGTGAPSTSAPSASGVGLASHRGTGAPSTSVATAAGAGANGKSGSGSPSTSIATAAGTGLASHGGTGAASTSVATAAGSGKDSPRGTGAPSTSIAAAAGTGIASRRGTGAPSTSVATAAGAAVASHQGTGAPSTSIPTSAGVGAAGVAGGAAIGSGAVSVPHVTCVGVGVVTGIYVTINEGIADLLEGQASLELVVAANTLRLDELIKRQKTMLSDQNVMQLQIQKNKKGP